MGGLSFRCIGLSGSGFDRNLKETKSTRTLDGFNADSFGSIDLRSISAFLVRVGSLTVDETVRTLRLNGVV